MMTWIRRMAGVLVVSALAGCGGEEAPEAETEVVVAEPAAGMEGMEGMQGMDMQGMGGMQMGGMMEQMQAHMQQMDGATGEQLQADLAQHRQMVANMVSQMNREMRDMNMTADAEWDTTIEGVREDLRRLPEMSAQELEGFMPEHRQRVTRLLEMHREMMANMQM